MKKYILGFCLSTVGFLNASDLKESDEKNTTPSILIPKIFDMSQLLDPTPAIKEELVSALQNDGLVSVGGVEFLSDLMRQFYLEMEKFISLSDEEKSKSTPDNWFESGWSYGRESVAGVKDCKKGSYYANYPDYKNVWPSGPFQDAFLNLSYVILQTGLKILPLIDERFQNEIKVARGLGRGLFYGAEEAKVIGENDAPWCGVHRDHGLFTALIPDLYHKDGMVVCKPQGAGLYVNGQEVQERLRPILVFQVGETLELLTKGKVRATPHHVAKAFDGVTRTTFAFFFEPPEETVVVEDISLLPETLLERTKNRLKSGQTTYYEWSMATYATWNKK